jgi:RimJ/RimL family protein N-acetyltransferase
VALAIRPIGAAIDDGELGTNSKAVASRSMTSSGADRIVLTELSVADAAEMVEVLSSPELYAFTGGSPPSLIDLEQRFTRQADGSGRDGEHWYNWIVRLAGPMTAIGYVQATVTSDGADVAWVVGQRWQGRGFAKEAAAAMCERLRRRGGQRITAHISPNHDASIRVAESLGLVATDEIDDDGEQVWATTDR